MTRSSPRFESRRKEDPRLITGKGRFVADLADATTLRAVFVRSPLPHGTLLSIDRGDAAAMPGVVGVFTASDLDLSDIPGGPPGSTSAGMARPPLARERVRHVGEAVAVVVAESEVQAVDAAERIWPDVDPLPPVIEPRDAASATPVFTNGNVAATARVEAVVDIEDSAAPIEASIEVHNQRLAPVPIEGLAILCRPVGDRLHIICGHQTPHDLRRQLAAALRMEPDDLRVTVPDVGGAFGFKGGFFAEYVAVAAAALRLARPVMWLESRKEHFLNGTHGRGQTHRVTLRGDRGGRIHSADIEILADVGAYPHNGIHVPDLTRSVATGLYDIPKVTVRSMTVVTTRTPTGSYRGAGRPEAAFAIERAMDVFARAAGRDPAEVRFTNFIKREDLPYQTATGANYDSGDYAAALERALALIDAEGVRAEQRRRREHGGPPLGLGIGAFVERTGGAAESGEYAEVEVMESGDLTVRTGSTSAGQGHETAWAQVVGDIFDIGSDRVNVVAGDTDAVAEGTGTFASRSTQTGAAAAFRMAQQVREAARAAAAEMMETAPDDLRMVDGRFEVAGVPGVGVSLQEIARFSAENGRPLLASEVFLPGTQTYPYGIHVAVVEVDRATGRVDLLRIVAVDDCGTVLNPMIVEGQMHGSLTQGIGQALLEGIEYSEDGIPLTTSLMDYLIPTAGDVPDLITDRLVHPAPSNPLGAKGTGEAGCIGAPPAIVNAVLDALAPDGVTDLAMPLRPHRVWEAMQRAQAERGRHP